MSSSSKAVAAGSLNTTSLASLVFEAAGRGSERGRHAGAAEQHSRCDGESAVVCRSPANGSCSATAHTGGVAMVACAGIHLPLCRLLRCSRGVYCGLSVTVATVVMSLAGWL